MNNLTTYRPIIGLEIHVELSTISKMFCGCSASWFGKKPNTNTCPVCLAMPGALPVPNQKAIEDSILLALSLNCKINSISKFDRKHYFYHDLPKGYQISQYDQPFGENGYMDVYCENNTIKRFRIKRVHLEEDTGKLSHINDVSLVDFNRAGVPLVEIVTEPDFTNALDVKKFLDQLQQTVRFLKISSADMEKGSMRLEPNISVQIPGEKTLPKYKVEVKNINSFRFAYNAINFEIERQIEILKNNKIPIQETRGYNEKLSQTVSQRTKEEAHDYRYFPEPDIPPFIFNKTYIDSLKKNIPELPFSKMKYYIQSFHIKSEDAHTIAFNKELSDFFEKVINHITKQLKKENIQITDMECKIASQIVNKKINENQALSDIYTQIISHYAIKTTDDKEILPLIKTIVSNHNDEVLSYKKGKTNVIGVFIGLILKEYKKPLDVQKLKSLIIDYLDNL